MLQGLVQAFNIEGLGAANSGLGISDYGCEDYDVWLGGKTRTQPHAWIRVIEVHNPSNPFLKAQALHYRTVSLADHSV